MHRVLRPLLLICLGCGLVVFWLLQGTRLNRPAEPPVAPASLPEIPIPGRDAVLRSLAIEAERNQLDKSIWATELMALKHEEVIVQLWDRLRNDPRPLEVLAQFAFDEIQLGQRVASEQLDSGIEQLFFGTPGRRLSAPQWRDWIAQWASEGYELVQSEWRQPRFDPGMEDTFRSVLAVTLHVRNPLKNEGWILEGEVGVNWRENRDPAGLPFPTDIEATHWRALRQSGEPAFEQVLSKRVETEWNPVFIDPLIVYDLNEDGLSEVILAGQNLLYRNHGLGRFQRARLCQEFTAALNAAVVADFNGDGAADLLAADREGLLFWPGERTLGFNARPKRIRFTTAELPNPLVLTAGDVDGDGHLDVWLGQYKLPYVAGQMPTPFYDANDGFPSFLLINHGDGTFEDRTAEANLAAKRFRRTYSASFVDLDDDTDQDLIVVSDFAGVDIYENNGQGLFTDRTESALDERHAFGMSHTFGDYNRDGKLDFLVIGMNSYAAKRLDSLGLWPPGASLDPLMRSRMAQGNRLYYGRDNRWAEPLQTRPVAESGWSWGSSSLDFDNDGDLDIYVVNGHKSRASTREYESQFWRHDIYVATSQHDPALDLYFRSAANRLYGAGFSYGGYEKNRLFLNRDGASFLEIGFLAGVAMEEDCRNLASADLDGDGKLDLALTTLQVWPEDRQALHLLRNRLNSAGNWIGFHLREGGPGYSPIGAKVTLFADDSQQVRRLVTGDSYRSQHPTTAHFGLGPSTQVDRVDIRWPNGQIQHLLKPAINRYHAVPLPQPSP